MEQLRIRRCRLTIAQMMTAIAVSRSACHRPRSSSLAPPSSPGGNLSWAWSNALSQPTVVTRRRLGGLAAPPQPARSGPGPPRRQLVSRTMSSAGRPADLGRVSMSRSPPLGTMSAPWTSRSSGTSRRSRRSPSARRSASCRACAVPTARGDGGSKGIAQVRLGDGTTHCAEVHWYEAHGVGRVELKIKRFLDDSP